MRLIDADALLENYNLKDATKYGNRDAEQLEHSYNTLMMYEIADMIEDAPTIDAVPKPYAEQIRWERDIAIEQLNEIGCQLGQKMDEIKEKLNAVPVVHGNYTLAFSEEENVWECSNCGARMDGKKNEEVPVIVVRCKDCKHWGMGITGETDRIKCCMYARYMVGENGYCVYGERGGKGESE